MSAPSLGLTTAQFFTRSRDPRAAFVAHDPQGTGRVNLDDAKKALETLGVKLNLTETRALLLQQADNDKGLPSKSLELNYDAFLIGVGAASPRSARAAPTVIVPEHAAGVAVNIANRMIAERGGVASEGWNVQLNNEPLLSASRKRSEYVTKGKVRLGSLGGGVIEKRAWSRPSPPHPPSSHL